MGGGREGEREGERVRGMGGGREERNKCPPCTCTTTFQPMKIL